MIFLVGEATWKNHPAILEILHLKDQGGCSWLLLASYNCSWLFTNLKVATLCCNHVEEAATSLQLGHKYQAPSSSSWLASNKWIIIHRFLQKTIDSHLWFVKTQLCAVRSFWANTGDKSLCKYKHGNVKKEQGQAVETMSFNGQLEWGDAVS